MPNILRSLSIVKPWPYSGERWGSVGRPRPLSSDLTEGSEPGKGRPKLVAEGPDKAEAERFLKLLDPAGAGLTFQTFVEKGHQGKGLERILNGSLDECWKELCRLNDAKAGVYVTVNQTDLKGRKGENIVRARTTLQEDDNGYVGDYPLAPSIVVESSPGKHHRYWLVADDWPADEQGRADFAGVMRRMVADYGSDENAKDISRVLRVPGFLHQKGEPHLVRIVEAPGHRYTREQIVAAFPPVGDAPRQKGNGRGDGGAFGTFADDLREPVSLEELAAMLEAIPNEPDTSRSMWKDVGLILHWETGGSEEGFSLFDQWSQLWEGYNADNTRHFWDTAKPRGEITARTLAKMAYDADRHWRDKIGEPQQPESTSRKLEYPLTPFNALVPGTTPAALVKGLIPRVGLAVVWGPPKCGKSFWTFDLCMHVALGWEYRGRRVQQGSVCYCAFEGASGFKARATAFRQQHEIDAGADVPFYLQPARIADLGAKKYHLNLIKDIKAQIGCPAVVVLDTLNRSLGGSESSDEDMSLYVGAADAIRETFNCVVIIIHHCGIDGTRPRGHTSLTGAAEAQLAVRRDGQGNVFVKVEWMKDGPEGAEVVSKLEMAQVGVDDDGAEITSCVVVPADPEEFLHDDGPTRRAPTGNNKIALDLLRKAITEKGEMPPLFSTEGKIPAETRVVDVEVWKTYCQFRMVTDSNNLASKQRIFRRARTDLQAAGFIGVFNEWVWLVPFHPGR